MTKKPKPSASWPAANVEMRSLDSIKAYDKNPRTHPPEQIALLAASMRDDGVTMPILVDDAGVIIAGHGRRLGALANGFTEYPVVVAKGWSEEQKRAARIKDNSYGLMSGWDQQLIRTEIGNLKVAGFDVALLGFPETQLRQWNISVGTESEQDPEFVPERPKKPVVRTGDLWVLGDHRLLCGDSTKTDDVAVVLNGEKLDLIFTDPPYNVAYSGLGQNRLGIIENDDQPDEEFEAWLNASFSAMVDALRENGCIYVCHPDSASGPKLAFERTFAKHFKKSATIIWVKQSAGMGWQDYRAQHEPILYGWKAAKKGKHYYSGDRAKTTVWQMSRDPQSTYIHPTQKPVALAEEAIYNSSKRGWNVGDFFAGSGSTLIGCHIAGRRCFAIETDPRFCSVIIERWEKFTGRKATLDGQTLAQVAHARRHGSARKPKDAPKAKGRPTVAAPA